MSWKPVLLGTLADAALERAEAIARALADTRTLEALDADAGGPSTAAAADLAGGRAGLAVFFEYVARTRGERKSRIASILLDEAISVVENTVMSPGLHEGFTGIAWACSHLLAPDRDDDPNAEVDEALIHTLGESSWMDQYDLIGGLVGIGVYALEQRPRPSADVMLALVLKRLAEAAQPMDDGVTWHTAPALMSEEQRAECPDGHYNLGVAHGVPGVIALLGLACETGHDEEARPLLERAVAWLLKQKLDPEGPSVFPKWVAPGFVPAHARLAWCYGDTGVAATLFIAARAAARPEWEREALQIAKRAAERSFERSGVRDAGLCHGAAGLAHIFNRMHQATGEAWLADAAIRWFGHTLDLRRRDEGLAGFVALERDADRHERWLAEPGLLTGAAGIGLALLAACSTVEPAWDRTLLL